MTLGANVKRLRELMGIALEPMAEAMGLDRVAGRQQIYAIETRGSKKSEIAPRLAEFFGIPLSDLLGEDLTHVTEEEFSALRNAHSNKDVNPSIIRPESLLPDASQNFETHKFEDVSERPEVSQEMLDLIDNLIEIDLAGGDQRERVLATLRAVFRRSSTNSRPAPRRGVDWGKQSGSK